MKQFFTEIKAYLLIAVMGLLFFVPYLGEVHLFDWDEINFAEAAREMIATGDYFTVRIDYQPFHEKPPLFIWMQALSMNIFGVNEFAARLPNAITGILTLLLVFRFGSKLFDERFGLLWALAYLGSFLPHFYFKTGIIDPVFNLFIYISIYYLFKFSVEKIQPSEKKKNTDLFILLSAVFSSLAILTKGPAALVIILLTWLIIWINHRKVMRCPWREALIFASMSFIPAFLWYGKDIFSGNTQILQQFIEYQIRLVTTQDAGHGGPIYYHLVVLLIGCFPASILAIRGFRRQIDDTETQRIFKRWNVILMSVVIVVFSLAETKIVHYSSLAYLPLTFLAAYAMYSIAYRNAGWKKTTSYLLGIIGFLMAFALTMLPLVLMNVNLYLEKITDVFTKSLLGAKVEWGGNEYFIGIFEFALLIVSLVLFAKRFYLKGFLTLFGSTAITVFVFLPVIAPKIEQYTQAAPIEFFESLQGKECYVETLGYKSYAHLFYSQKPLELSAYSMGIPNEQYDEWLLMGDIDKPAYFSAKIKGYEQYLDYPGMSVLYTKNGFVFLKRDEIRKTGYAEMINYNSGTTNLPNRNCRY